MKKILIFLISSILIVACKKEEPIVIANESPVLENALISGTNCTSFYRLIKGSGMEEIYAAKQTSEGGFIFCGSTSTIAENATDILVIKTDCFGATEWKRTISNNFSDNGYDIIQISTGEYVLVASYSVNASGTPITNYQGQLIKLTNAGELIWKKEYDFGNATQLTKIIENSDGGFTVCGSANSNGAFVFKTDASGTEIWRKVLNSNIRLHDITKSSNSNYLVCGSITSNQQEDIFVAELSVLGDIVWTKSIDKNNITNEATSIVSVGSDFIISGYNRTSGIDLPGFAMKLNATGDEIWYKSLEIEGIDQLSKITLTQDNEILGVGAKSNLLSLVKINLNDGSIIWENNKQTDPLIRDLKLTNDGGFIITGNLFVANDNRDGFILKTDLNGN